MDNRQQELKEMYARLTAPFLIEIGGKTYPDLKWKPQNKVGSDKYSCIAYIDRSRVQDRLNEVFNLDGWQFEIKREADGSKTGVLSCYVIDKWISRSDTGTQSQQEGEKGATSDALKRCATHFGVGTYVNKIPNMIIQAKLNNGNKLVPVDKNGRFLYGDKLSAFCNGMSSEQGVLAQLIQLRPDLWKQPEIKKLWQEMAN